MIVVADTSPLNYLIQVEGTVLLAKLYGEVVVPASVVEELASEGGPEAVIRWSHSLPPWIKIQNPTSIPSGLEGLGNGERDAIALGVELHANFILIDERKGTKAARIAGINPIGVLGVFLLATEIGAGDGRMFYRKLMAETNFFASARLLEEFEILLLQKERRR
jgi:predicted nucleic acid-binding protein